jgi:L-amino acid N-acyltransferase
VTPMNVRIRLATAGDLGAIDEIYNHYVMHSTCTYQIEPEAAADRRAWFESHGPGHPVIVAEAAGEVAEAAGEVAGWGALSPFRARAGYRHTVEDSVYVRHDLHRRGIGSLLLAELVACAGRLGYHAIIAGIDREQKASVALHQRHGFVQVGLLREVGFKFGRWLDVIYMERLL